MCFRNALSACCCVLNPGIHLTKSTKACTSFAAPPCWIAPKNIKPLMQECSWYASWDEFRDGEDLIKSSLARVPPRLCAKITIGILSRPFTALSSIKSHRRLSPMLSCIPLWLQERIRAEGTTDGNISASQKKPVSGEVQESFQSPFSPWMATILQDCYFKYYPMKRRG